MNEKIFRKNDIRGIFPQELNLETIIKIIQILEKYFFKKGKILIAHDVRAGSLYLYKKIIALLKKNKKIKVIKGELMSTPMFYYLIDKLKTNGGIMITASHNPKNYNGLKIINKKNEMIAGKTILKLIKKNESK